MKPLEEPMGMYTAYHRHTVNRAIHYVMVPAIVWSLMVALDLVPLFVLGGTTITLAFPIVALLLIWYLMLDFTFGVASAAVFTMLLVSAIVLNVSVASPTTSLIIAGCVFVGSWVFQFLGHGVWEKRRPALVDNVLQVLIAPMFLVAETAFAMGFKKDLEQRIEAVAKTHAKA